MRSAALLSLIFLLAAGIGTAWGSWRNLCADCPSIAQILTWEPEQTSKIFDRNGRLIDELGVERRTPVSIHALPDHVVQAFIAVEDQGFYEHDGYSIRGMARAFVVRLPGMRELLNRRAGGGSTITQQLARNMFEQIGFEDRLFRGGLLRKLRELQVALDLERSYEKDQILEAYINQINYAHGWWGIQTAARNYFGKNASQLNPAEGALLAAVVNRPSDYSPFNYPDNALERRNLVLQLMADQGYLSQDEADRWKRWPVPTDRGRHSPGEAPYFVEWVRQILYDRFGGEVYTGGFRVHTTLDSEMQRTAEEAMEAGWRAVESRPEYDHPLYEEFADRGEGFEGGLTPYLQGAFIALDPETGAVRAMIGGRDFEHSEFNRATQARRQPGSAFKPFVYAAAIESRIPASHIIVDAPVVLPQLTGGEWKPRNFGGEFLGPMTIREGLYRSRNIVAIKLAVQEVGLETVAQVARRMGIQTEIERFPSTAIGANEVIPIQMAEAYSAFATLGTKVRPHPIRRVENARGEVVWEPTPERTEVLDSAVARITLDMLRDVVVRGTAYNALRVRSELPYDLPAAGKTGTTNDGTNVWFAGVTPDLVGVVWMGMDRPQPIWMSAGGASAATGGGDAAPVWGRFMRRVYYGIDEEADSAEVDGGEADVDSGQDGGGETGDPAREAGAREEVDPGGTPAELVYGEEARDPAPLLPVPDPWPMPPGLITRRVDRETGLLASPWCPDSLAYTEIYIPGTEPTEQCDRQSPGGFEPSFSPSLERP